MLYFASKGGAFQPKRDNNTSHYLLGLTEGFGVGPVTANFIK
jgi:hypothetical protein